MYKIMHCMQYKFTTPYYNQRFTNSGNKILVNQAIEIGLPFSNGLQETQKSAPTQHQMFPILRVSNRTLKPTSLFNLDRYFFLTCIRPQAVSLLEGDCLHRAICRQNFVRTKNKFPRKHCQSHLCTKKLNNGIL